MFQIESPGQRELVGKLGPSRFDDLVVDISLFRPGPVKSDMITPFLNSRHGWSERRFLHPSLIPALEETEGVVVFHEQVLLIVAETTGVSLAQADEVRRSMGTPKGQADVEAWWRPAAAARGYSARGPRPDLGGAEVVRELRLLQGARRGLRAAHLPLGVAQGAPPGGLPRRRAHPRPGDVPEAAASSTTPAPSASRCSASTSTPRATPTASSGSTTPGCGTRRMPGTAGCRVVPAAAPPRGGASTSPTASGSRSPTSRASARPRSRGSSPASPTPTSATSGPAPG